METNASTMKSIDQLKKEAERRLFRRAYMIEYRQKMKDNNTPLKRNYDKLKNSEKCRTYYLKKTAIVDIKNLFIGSEI